MDFRVQSLNPLAPFLDFFLDCLGVNLHVFKFTSHSNQLRVFERHLIIKIVDLSVETSLSVLQV